jgi:RNA polymerase sigma factor (sigma-70 family)
MANAPLGPVLRRLRALAGRAAPEDRTDGQLLECFVGRRDEAAFTALVRRHGPMVLGVCRRVLHNAHDAEDAFQATFLVLVRQAASIRKLDSLGSWLHGVAFRTALRARSDAARRRVRERGAPMAAEEPSDVLAWRELRAVLDEEVNRLPEQYRAPFVLCHLEGHTNAQAARRLGFPLGSLSKRLARARHLLRLRLSRRGVTLAPGLLLTLLADEAAAKLPARVVDATVGAALRSGAGISPQVTAVADAVHKSLAAAPFKVGAVLLALAALALGAGLIAHQVPAVKPAEGKQQAQAKPPTPKPSEIPEKITPQVRTDRYGDPLPDGALVRLGTVRFRVGFLTYSLAVSPDGKTLVTGAAGRPPCVLDMRTGKVIRELGKRSHIMGVAFSPDGQKVALADNPVRLYDVASGREIAQLEGHQNGVPCVAFSPDGKTLASGSHDQTIRLWEVATGKELRRCEGHQSSVYALAFSPDGKTLASGSLDKTIRLWDPATGKERRRLLGHQEDVLAVAISPDGQWLASGSADHTVRLWDVARGQQVQVFKGHGEQVRAVAFSPNGRLLASGGQDPVLHLWQVAERKELRRIDTGMTWGCFGLAFARDGKTLLSGGIWDSAIHSWDVATGQERRRFGGHFSLVNALAFSPDGKTLFTASRNKAIRLWDVATGTERGRLSGKHHGFDRVAFSPDRRTVAVGGWLDGTLHLRDVATGKEGRMLGKHGQRVRGLAFAPDGKALVSGGEDETAMLWDLAGGKEIRRFPKLGFIPSLFVFSPDGKKLVVGGDTNRGAFVGGRSFRLLDVATGKLLRKVESSHVVHGVAFSPDGRLLASVEDGLIRLWDVAAEKEIRSMQVEHPLNYGPAFSPDGRLLATGGEDSVIHLWETATGTEIRRFLGHHSAVAVLRFSPDGRTLASGSGDSTALIWDVTGRIKDGRLQGRPLSAKEVQARWTNLASADAATGYPAVWDLVAAPAQSIPFLKEKLRPPTPADPGRVAQLIADLDSKRYAVRQKATRELEELGELAAEGLRKKRTADLPLETRQRLDRLIQRLGRLSAQRLQGLRALTVLEQVGTPQARGVLEALARGPAGVRLTADARAVLKRLDGRSKGKPR